MIGTLWKAEDSQGGSDVNIYRNLGDRVGTLEARELAAQPVAWHDAMVNHVRVADATTGWGRSVRRPGTRDGPSNR